MKNTGSKYLTIGEAFYPEEFLINDLVKEWERNGYQLEVLTRTPSYPFGKVYNGYKNKLYQKERWGNILIHRFPVIQGYHKSTIIKILNYLSFVIFGTIIALFIGRRYKRIFIYHTGPLSLAIPGILLKKLYGIPVTIWSFDLWPATIYAYGFKKTKVLSWFLDNIVKWIYRNCENIIVSSEGFIPELKKYTTDKHIHFAPNWSQTALINKQKSSIRLPAGKTHFTFTGNVGKVQNLENVIRGFKKADIPDACLNIFGDGSLLKTLRGIVSDEEIQNVNFHGRVPVYEIEDLLSQSDILVISLIPDPVMGMTIPLKFQTYLQASKPIFAIMQGEVEKLVNEHKLGECADPTDINEIAIKFRSFISVNYNRTEIVKNCEYITNTMFDRKKIIDLLSEVCLNDNKGFTMANISYPLSERAEK